MRVLRYWLPPLAAACFVSTVFSQETKLLDDDGEASNAFGAAMAIDRDVMVVGSLQDTVDGVPDAGSVNVFRWNGSAWVEIQEMVNSGGDEFDYFGFSVAIDKDVIVVGQPGDIIDGNEFQGSATVYRWNGSSYVEEDFLTSSIGDDNDEFGFSVAVSGNVIVVGAVRDNPGFSEFGMAVVFRWNGIEWVEEQTLYSSDPQLADSFGHSVDVDRDVIVAGARLADYGGNVWQGTATVFRWNGVSWLEEQLLVAGNGEADDRFGYFVTVDEDVIAVSAPWDDVGANGDQGTVRMFSWGGSSWSEVQELVTSTGEAGDRTGISMYATSDTVIAGVPTKTVNGNFAQGAATVFRWNGTSFAEDAYLTASDGEEFDSFAHRVSVNGDVVLVGSPGDDIGPNPSQGSIYAYGGFLVAEDLDLDQGETAVLEPGDDGGPPTTDVSATVTNETGQNDETVTVSESDNFGSDATGFGVFGVNVIVETTMEDGEFSMTLTVPLSIWDLGGANPMLIDLAYLDTTSGRWQLAAQGNTANSPGHPGPIGDRYAVQSSVLPDPPYPSTELGDYGVYWNSSLGAGYVWANVDHTTDYKVGLKNMEPYGCDGNPESSLVPIDGFPTLGTTLTLGVDDPYGSSPGGSLAILLVSLTPDPNYPCGTHLPGYGMGAPTGELLVGLLPPNPVAILGPVAWSAPGSTADLPIPIPNDPGLVDAKLYLQGILASASTIRFTAGLKITVGE